MMTTPFFPILAIGDWTLDTNWCALLMGLGLLKTLAFVVIVIPILLPLWMFLRERFCPETCSTGDADDSAHPPAVSKAATQALGAATSRVDESLGLLFDERPDEIDDLKHITGVAGVLEGRLQNFGIYTYRQIAIWSDEVAKEFGERLSFSDRVFRDKWREQCAQLHRKKYGSDPS